MKAYVHLAAVLVMVPAVAFAAPPPSLVTVENTSSNPVPIAGSVAVTSIPALTVGQAAPQAVQLFISAWCDWPGDFCEFLFPDIPAGKRLLVETIGIRGELFRTGMIPDVSISTFVGGTTPGTYPLPVTMGMRAPGATHANFMSLASLRLYADSGNPAPRIYLTNLEADATAFIAASISGQYVDLP